jgi:CRISPR/Cas system CMR-associated protein Cmr1 (group 7 of RAMP superfamily)
MSENKTDISQFTNSFNHTKNIHIIINSLRGTRLSSKHWRRTVSPTLINHDQVDERIAFASQYLFRNCSNVDINHELMTARA